MAEFVFFVILVLPATLGLAEILHIVKRWFLSSGKGAEKILIIIPDNDNFQRQILALLNEYKWQGNKLAEKIYILNFKLDEENRKECTTLAQKVGFIVLEHKNLNILEI